MAGIDRECPHHLRSPPERPRQGPHPPQPRSARAPQNASSRDFATWQRRRLRTLTRCRAPQFEGHQGGQRSSTGPPWPNPIRSAPGAALQSAHRHRSDVPTCNGPRRKRLVSTWLGSPRTTTTVVTAAIPAIPRRPSRASSAAMTTTAAAIIAGTRNRSMPFSPVTSSTNMYTTASTVQKESSEGAQPLSVKLPDPWHVLAGQRWLRPSLRRTRGAPTRTGSQPERGSRPQQSLERPSEIQVAHGPCHPPRRFGGPREWAMSPVSR